MIVVTAEDPCMKDIGILAFLDPIAIDQAGIHTIEAASELGFGSREYELIYID